MPTESNDAITSALLIIAARTNSNEKQEKKSIGVKAKETMRWR